MATESTIPSVTDADVTGQLIFDKAKQQFPYLADKDIAYKYSPQKNPKYMLESYKGDDAPSWGQGRKAAIEVFNPATRPIDILGDYVSHYAVESDPKMAAYYQQFQNALDPAVMQKRYKYHVANLGEKRPYDQWYQATGLPEIFRGYTFDQFGTSEKAKQMYNAQQLQILDQVRNYLGIK